MANFNIKLKVDKNFSTALKHLVDEYGEDFEYLNGFHESQMNFSDFINGFIDKNVADVTIDANANASNKDIVSMKSEKGKPHDKLFAFNKIFYELNKKYGLDTAREWLKTEYNGGFYLHDAPTTSYMPYCYAYDLSRLSREGLFFLSNYNAQPPQHLTTYFDDVIEFVSYMCNRSSGAVGLPNVLIWSFYFWKHDCENGYFIKNPEYYLRQNFQKFIYRLNQPFLRIDQSSFTNVSIFDRNYIEELFGGLVYPDGTYAIDYVEELIEHQKVFMEVVSEIRETNMFTFPVLTYSLLYQNGKFVDESFARWCSDHNVKWNDSNFFVSDNVGTLSNCCFSGEQRIEVLVDNNFGKPTCYSFKYLVDNNICDVYVRTRDGFKKAHINTFKPRKMYKITVEIDRDMTSEMIVTDNHIFPTINKGDKYVYELNLNDVLLTTSGEYGNIICIEPTEYYDEYVYCCEMEDSTNPYFVLPNGIITHNCRLLSDTTKLNAFINSIGGTALSIGSVKVNTINLMRIYYEVKKDEDRYLSLLKHRTELCCKTLDCIRHIISRNVEKGLLPNYCEGGIELSKQYCTVGM